MTSDSRIDGDVNGDGVVDGDDVSAALNGAEDQQQTPPANPNSNPPAGGTTPPAGGTTPPAGGTTPPAGGTTPPAGGTTPPAGGTTPPAGGTTPPAGGSGGGMPSGSDNAVDRIAEDEERARREAERLAGETQAREALAEQQRRNNEARDAHLRAERERDRIEAREGRDLADRTFGDPTEDEHSMKSFGRTAMRGTLSVLGRAWDATKGTANFMLNSPDARPLTGLVAGLAGGLIAYNKLKGVIDENLGKIPLIGGLVGGIAKLSVLLGIGGLIGGAVYGFAPQAGRLIFKSDADRIRALSDEGLQASRTPAGDGTTPVTRVTATTPEAEDTARVMNDALNHTRGAAGEVAGQQGTNGRALDPGVAGPAVSTNNTNGAAIPNDVPRIRVTVIENGRSTTFTPDPANTNTTQPPAAAPVPVPAGAGS